MPWFQVWGMLTSLSDQQRHDELAITSIRFLTIVVSQQWHQELFGTDQVLQTMCEKVVIPNIRMRASDVELFETNGVEYVWIFLFRIPV